jgi:hypothetical protein
MIEADGFVFSADALFLLVLCIGLLLAASGTPSERPIGATLVRSAHLHDLAIVWETEGDFDITSMDRDLSTVFPHSDTDLTVDGHTVSRRVHGTMPTPRTVLSQDYRFVASDGTLHRLTVRVYG